MNEKKIALIIGLGTILTNLVFAFTGVSHTLSCELARAGGQVAAVLGGTEVDAKTR